MKKPLLSELTLREKIGQMANYRSTVIQDKVLNNAEDLSLIGSVWVIGGLDMRVVNMSDETSGKKVPAKANWKFMQQLTETCKIPPLACMDSTNGIYGQFYDMSMTMNPNTIGATGSAELSFEMGRVKANELKCGGAKWLWGPEEDMVARNAAISIGRTFSDDQDLVIKLAVAQNKGIQDQRVAATAKHFPGTDGLEYRDAHTAETVMRLNKKDWWEHQGRVYQEVFDAGVYSVMVAHSSFPAIDDTRIGNQYIPSTVSKKVVTDLLKGEMGFKGVVITDAIEMEGLISLFDKSMEKVMIETVKAGNDVILGVKGNFIDVIEQAVLSGEIPESRIDDACQRVLDMKEKLGLFDEPLEAMDQEKCLAETKEVNEKIAEKALSLVCDNRKMLPLNKDKIKSVCIIFQGESKDVYDSLEYMEDELRKHGVEKIHRQTALHDEPEPSTLPLDFDIMLYVPHIGLNKPWGVAGFQGEIYKTMYRVTAGGQIGKRIVINLGWPGVWYDYYTTFDCFINAYNYTEITQRNAIKALYGELPFDGIHPFRLIPKGYEINF
ncbi:MAG: hypothetical protein IKK13_03735 [Clostridia bacterium]|nr:hypothetical protein [Clostridia bacterium]